jgi:peptidoglycan/LPS O-acetylase OafA/YrhL
MLTALRAFARLPQRYGRVTERGTYVPQIDGMRFLAILPVMFWHACIRATRQHPEIDVRQAIAHIPHGHVGVELFFFISGYIIAFPFLAGRAPTIKHFFLRRLYRLEPPYFVAMIVAFLALSATGYKPTDALSFRGDISLWQSLLASLTYTHGIIFGAPSTLNPPAWSLEVEIQFYLLSPLLLWGYMRIGAAPVRMTVGLVLCAAWMLFACWLDSYNGRYAFEAWTIVGHMPAFLLGIVFSDFALRHRPFQAATHPGFDILFVLGIAMLLVAGQFWSEERSDLLFGVGRDTAKLIAVAMIYLGGARGVFGRWFLGLPWIALIGGMCYSIYLTHIMVFQAVHLVLHKVMPPLPLVADFAIWFTVLTPIGIACGFVYYLLIERPCMEPNWPAKLLQRLRGGQAAGAERGTAA